MHKKYLIREFRPSVDLNDAYACYISSFYHTEWPLVDGADHQFIKDNLLLLHYLGSKTLVAEADGGARGILVGLLRPRLTLAGRALKAAAKILYRLITGRYRMNTLAKKHCFQHVRGFLPYIFLHPSGEAETLLLISQKEYRGGIGRALMDEWIEEVRSKGLRNATVGTDSALSWDFYERYGYQRVREFNFTAYKYSLPAKKVKGYIYSLDIEQGDAR
jgi:ribosomal protein S18 acetylase RimI-like enzyme